MNTPKFYLYYNIRYILWFKQNFTKYLRKIHTFLWNTMIFLLKTFYNRRKYVTANRIDGFDGGGDDNLMKDEGCLDPRWKHKMIFARWSLIVVVVATQRYLADQIGHFLSISCVVVCASHDELMPAILANAEHNGRSALISLCACVRPFMSARVHVHTL